MKNLLYPIIVLFGLGGCSLASGFAVLDEVRDKGVEVGDAALDSAADAADKYCVVPDAVRLWLRNQLNARTDTATIMIDCGGES